MSLAISCTVSCSPLPAPPGPLSPLPAVAQAPLQQQYMRQRHGPRAIPTLLDTYGSPYNSGVSPPAAPRAFPQVLTGAGWCPCKMLLVARSRFKLRWLPLYRWCDSPSSPAGSLPHLSFGVASTDTTGLVTGASSWASTWGGRRG